MTSKIITCTTPGGALSPLAVRLLDATHLLIAGSTGSGKSVAVRLLIDSILRTKAPFATDADRGAQLVLIDPKRVDLVDYTDLPHGWVLDYASEVSEAVRALSALVRLMMNRYADMQAARIKQTNRSAIYCVIEEYADLTCDRADRRQIEPLVRRLLQLGRASGIHCVIVTQRPTSDIINGIIKTNVDYRLALHTATPQDSRNIITKNGAEGLLVGEGLYYSPAGIERVSIPFISSEDARAVVDYWNTPEAIRYEYAPKQPSKPFLRSLFGKLA